MCADRPADPRSGRPCPSRSARPNPAEATAVASQAADPLVSSTQGKLSTLPASELCADAIERTFAPRMQGGRAIAELLLGRIEPSGRLPLSVPRPAGQLPVYDGQVRGHHVRPSARASATRRRTTRNRQPRIVTSPVRTPLPGRDGDAGQPSCKRRLTAVRRRLHDCQPAAAGIGTGIGGTVGVLRRRGSRPPAW
ncbi:glycoside hydrolase family 3 C-terminal domain-containing protein [Streptomyces sp. NPDC001668]|uniref:glycoside hydrolase family 3 C-terminal domain-containing protein n=1 Tax=unclassified Streptomyces TaxID=2593676 RepID=UPI0036CD0AB8